MSWKHVEDTVGNTSIVRLRRIPGQTTNVILAKIEGDNPAGSVKDRAAFSMIKQAAIAGKLKEGDAIVEATSGNMGIALAMASAVLGYRIILVMPRNASRERVLTMEAYGAKVVLTESMEEARDKAAALSAAGEALELNQFSNPNNPLAHYEGTGPEIWRDTEGKITHFVSSMGSSGTLMGVGRYLREKNPDVQLIGVQPDDTSNIAGIRKWPEGYVPSIRTNAYIDRIIEVSAFESAAMARRLAKEEGIFAGVSSGGALQATLKLSAEVKNAVIVTIFPDRGDRYLSTNLFG